MPFTWRVNQVTLASAHCHNLLFYFLSYPLITLEYGHCLANCNSSPFTLSRLRTRPPPPLLFSSFPRSQIKAEHLTIYVLLSTFQVQSFCWASTWMLSKWNDSRNKIVTFILVLMILLPWTFIVIEYFIFKRTHSWVRIRVIKNGIEIV